LTNLWNKFSININLLYQTTYSWGLGVSKEGVVFDKLGHIVFHPSIDVKELSIVVCAFHIVWFSTIVFFLPVYSSFVLSWSSFMKHMLFCDHVSSHNIYIHYIHYVVIILTWATIFPFEVDVFFSLEHLLHLCKFWTICHLVSIQTTYMTCIWTIFLNFMITSGSLYQCYSWFLFFLHCTCVYIVIISTTIWVVFVSLSYFCL